MRVAVEDEVDFVGVDISNVTRRAIIRNPEDENEGKKARKQEKMHYLPSHLGKEKKNKVAP